MFDFLKPKKETASIARDMQQVGATYEEPPGSRALRRQLALRGREVVLPRLGAQRQLGVEAAQQLRRRQAGGPHEGPVGPAIPQRPVLPRDPLRQVVEDLL